MQKVIQHLKVNQTIKEYFLLTSIQTKLGKNGTYFEMTLVDASGEIKGRKWDLTEKDYQFYDVIQWNYLKSFVLKVLLGSFNKCLI